MKDGKITEEEKSIISSMRNNNKSYSDIAKTLDCTTQRIKAYCNRNNLGGRRGKVSTDKNEIQFANAFNDKYQNFKYHSGFESVDAYFVSECKICGSLQKRSAQCLRRDREIKCNNCIEINKARKQFVAILNRYAKDTEKKNRQLSKAEESINKRTCVCNECGKTFIGKVKGLKYCSDKCFKRYSNRKSGVRKRRRFKNTKIDWSISLDKLIKRDNNICHICGGKCNKKDYKIVDGNFVVGAEYPSIDHVIPASKGGTHTWGNVKLAHHYCNTIKNNNDIYEMGTGQLTMVI